ncbi:hypothetical protein [Haloprofundus marisrubri]|uniref:hypothetical protein n=1 Tax=Haloprofundus marisrubri TaxID=1514971 RepID=UPI0012BB1980|nr:hypothetical protein [Haloprofundus marisrubri]
MTPLVGGDQQGPVTVGLINSANETQTFEVWVVDDSVEKIGVKDSSGEVGNLSMTPGLRSFHPEGYDHPPIAVVLPESARHVTTANLTEGSTRELTVEDPPNNPTVIISVKSDGRIVEIVTATCDRNLRYVEVTGQDDHASGAYNC